MATLNAFGFSVQKAHKQQEEPVKPNAQQQQQQQNIVVVEKPGLPWAYLSKTPSTPPRQGATKSKIAPKNNSKKSAANLKNQNAITRYLVPRSSSSPKSRNATVEQQQEHSKAYVLRQNIPLATIWPQIVQEYSMDPMAVEEQQQQFTTAPCRRRRRRSSYDETEESESKTIKVDGELLRAFQRLATGSTVPFHFTGRRLPPREQEQDYDGEDRTRQVRKRMTVEESQQYIQQVMIEFLMV